MNERKYNEAEVAAIFERATEARSPGTQMTSSAEGMTLAQIQEIAAEVGISSSAIASAATVVDQPAPVAQRTLLGLPLGAARTVHLDRALTDHEWELLVSELRETFNAPGQLTTQGSLRQWTNGNLQVLLEPTTTGHRIRLRTEKRGAGGQLIVGAALFVGAGAALSTAVGDRGLLAALGVAFVTGGIMMATTVFPLRSWARTRQQQFDAIAARVALTTKSLPPGTEK